MWCDISVLSAWAPAGFFPGVGIEGSERRSPQQGPGAAPLWWSSGEASWSWRHFLRMMHKYSVYWGFRQHLQQKTLFQLFQGASAPPPPPLAHACGHPWLSEGIISMKLATNGHHVSGQWHCWQGQGQRAKVKVVTRPVNLHWQRNTFWEYGFKAALFILLFLRFSWCVIWCVSGSWRWSNVLLCICWFMSYCAWPRE